MCSTPKSRNKVKASLTNNSDSILSTISNQKRQSFAQRANQASDRRIEEGKLKREEQRVNALKFDTTNQTKNHTLSPLTNVSQHWIYWLLNAPFSELMRKQR